MTLKRFIKNSLVVTCLVFPLIWLYMDSELGMSRKAHEVDMLLLNVIQVDTELTERVLRTRSQLTLHYDDISSSQKRLHNLLAKFPMSIINNSTALKEQLSAITELSLETQNSLDRFKSINSQVSQRQRYIKYLAEEIERTSPSSTSVINEANHIVIEVFNARIFGYQISESDVKNYTENLLILAKNSNQKTQLFVEKFLNHFKELSLLANKETIIVSNILEHKLRNQSLKIRKELLANHYKELINSKDIQRYLTVYAGFLLILILFFVLNRRHLKRYASKHKQHSERDELTQLYNRRVFLKKLESIIHSQSGALLFIDLDGFKRINDQLGHNVGDETLQMVASKLKNVIELNESNHIFSEVFRLGGDEFVVLIENIDGTYSTDCLEDFASSAVKECAFNLTSPNDEYFISISVGIAQFPECGKDIADLLNCADKAMYESKQRGRSCYTFYNEISQL